jgi:hypothetical protein
MLSYIPSASSALRPENSGKDLWIDLMQPTQGKSRALNVNMRCAFRQAVS